MLDGASCNRDVCAERRSAEARAPSSQEHVRYALALDMLILERSGRERLSGEKSTRWGERGKDIPRVGTRGGGWVMGFPLGRLSCCAIYQNSCYAYGIFVSTSLV